MLCGASPHDTRERPFSRSYGAILPSSLTMDHPITLVFSTRLPVSVCGTVTPSLARGFSRQHGLNLVALPRGGKLPFGSRLCVRDGFAYPSAYHLRRRYTSRSLASCVPPLLVTIRSGTGISTCCPSASPFGYALGPTDPKWINLASEPLGLRCA